MLAKTTIEKLKALGINADEIVNAVKDGKEIEVSIPDGQLFTEAQIAERDDVKMSEGEKNGEKAAKTALIKEVASKAGLSIQGDRMADLVKGITEGMAKDKDAAFKALQDQNAALIADNEKYKGEVTAAQQQLKQGMFEISLLSKLPANGLGLSAKESYELAKLRGYSVEQTENGNVWKKNGEVLKDPATHAPLAEDKAIHHIWTTEKFAPATPTPPSGGRGAGQKPPTGNGGVFSKQSEVQAAFREQYPNADPNGVEFVNFYKAALKDNPDIDVLN